MTLSICAVAGVPPSAGKIERHFGDIGAGQVVDGDGVRAAQRVEVDLFDLVEVHRDVADVAEEPRALAVRRDVDGLVRHWRR